jgi:hypothetical protein
MIDRWLAVDHVEGSSFEQDVSLSGRQPRADIAGMPSGYV